MKSAAVFSTFLALCLAVATDDVQATPSLRGLRLNSNEQATKEDESNRGLHHHRPVEKGTTEAKKVTLAEGPQLILITIPVPSSMVVKLDTVSDRRPAATPALIKTALSTSTNATDQPPATQVPGTPDNDPRMIEVPFSPILDDSFEGDLGLGLDIDLKVDDRADEVNTGISKTILSGTNRMDAPNNDLFGRDAGIGGKFNGFTVDNFNQRMGFEFHGGHAYNGLNRQSTLKRFSQTGGNKFAGPAGGRRHLDYGLNSGNNINGGDFYRRRRG